MSADDGGTGDSIKTHINHLLSELESSESQITPTGENADSLLFNLVQQHKFNLNFINRIIAYLVLMNTNPTPYPSSSDI